ncbi:hypothetical protein [Streptomyces sp. NPDC048248]|uniref:hypothetical protein n=1 Tax=Streptomyces sp. NPDC048248 TaxID=3365523 RepID=UPI003711ED0E
MAIQVLSCTTGLRVQLDDVGAVVDEGLGGVVEAEHRQIRHRLIGDQNPPAVLLPSLWSSPS